MNQFDKNRDGRIQRTEVQERLYALFDALDVNGDKEVTLKELRRLTEVR